MVFLSRCYTEMLHSGAVGNIRSSGKASVRDINGLLDFPMMLDKRFPSRDIMQTDGCDIILLL